MPVLGAAFRGGIAKRGPAVASCRYDESPLRWCTCHTVFFMQQCASNADASAACKRAREKSLKSRWCSRLQATSYLWGARRSSCEPECLPFPCVPSMHASDQSPSLHRTQSCNTAWADQGHHKSTPTQGEEPTMHTTPRKSGARKRTFLTFGCVQCTPFMFLWMASLCLKQKRGVVEFDKPNEALKKWGESRTESGKARRRDVMQRQRQDARRGGSERGTRGGVLHRRGHA